MPLEGRLTRDVCHVKEAEHTFSSLLPPLAQRFSLTEEDLARLLPSDRQRLFRNRVHWASFYLLKARLLDRPRRGHIGITDRNALRQPSVFNAKFLDQYPEFQEFIGANRGPDEPTPPTTPPTPQGVSQTPEEQLEAGYQRYRERLASNVLSRVRSCSPAFFEQLVMDLVVALGCGGSHSDAGQAVGRSGDGGLACRRSARNSRPYNQRLASDSGLSSRRL